MKLSLKEILFVLFNILGDIVSNTCMPLLTTLIKSVVISTVLYLLFHFAPHNIEFLNNLNFVSCFVITISVRLLRFKYDDFEENADQPIDPNTPNYLNDEEEVPQDNQTDEEKELQLLVEQTPAPSNIRNTVNDSESTRE